MVANRVPISIMRIRCILLFLLRIWLCWWSVRADASNQGHPTVVWTEVNGEAELPCQVSTPVGDKINMVLWFKDQTGIPIYSFDARGVETTNGIHMALSNLEKRCSFTPSDVKGGSLRIFKITNNDAGLYKCRVDFSNSPTQQSKLTLAIAELPSMPVILTPMGSAEDSVGPYDEDDSFELTCIVSGGNPTPQISWWIDGEPLYGYMKESGSKVSSHLIVHSVRRGYNGKYLECRVNVTGVSTGLSQRVRLKIYVKPIAVSIVNGNNIISDGESAKFVCDCFGSNPPADISWLLEGEPIRSSAITVMQGNTTTTSTLTIRADPTFNNKSLFCKCENVEFPGYYLQDKRTLQVYYRPLVQIVSRPKFNFNKIKEGDNISLECAINANPPANDIRWFHDGKMVDSEKNKPIYNLRDVSLLSEGEYECEAANVEGQTRSSKLRVNILHAPYCQEGFENQTVMAAALETVILQCEVESGAANRHVQFYWTLNNTRRIVNLANHQIQSSGKSSILKYTPEADDDFGMIACWAQNDVGPQRVPCYFRLNQANKPDRPRNCFTNNTGELLQVTCEPGFDGGLKQYFVLEIRMAPNSSTFEVDNPVVEQLNDQAVITESKTVKPLYKIQKENPVFDIFRLDSGTPYLLVLYAVNLKGKSEPVVLTQEMKSSATNIVSSEISASQDTLTLPSIYVIIMALIVLIASLVIMTAIILACRSQNASRHENLNELNNFHIVYPEPDDHKRASHYESEF